MSFIYLGHSKCQKPCPGRKATAEHYCYNKHATNFNKGRKINSDFFFLVSVQMRPITKYELCCKSKIWEKLRII